MVFVDTIYSALNTSLGKFILIIAIAILTVVLQRSVSYILKKSFVKSSKVLKVDETKYRFSRHFISAVIYLVGAGVAVYTVPALRTLAISLFAGAGILAIVVGFASQQALSNVVSGIFIVMFKPFRVGDRLSIGTTVAGVVEDITLRHTVIRNFENKRVIVPNSVISNETLENASITEEKVCRFFEMGIAYDADHKKAMKIMQKLAEKHPLVIDNRTKEEKDEGKPVVAVKIIRFADSAVVLRAWVWAKNGADSFSLFCDLNLQVKEAFDKAEIEIPYPHRTIVQKN